MAAPISELTDNFEGSSFNTAKWTVGTNGAGTTLTQSGGVAIFAPASSVAFAEAYLPYFNFTPTFDLTGTYCLVNLVQPLNEIATLETGFSVILDDNNLLVFKVVENPRRLYAIKYVGGVQTNITSVPYDSAAMQWLRIRESGGTVYYDYSSNGHIDNWTNLTSLANPFAMFPMYPKLNAYANNIASPGIAIFDNFNIPPDTAIGNYEPYIKVSNGVSRSERAI